MAQHYIHGTSAKEQARLELMNGLLNQRCLAAIRPKPGDRVLEMGAGTGIFACELAKAVGAHGAVLGVERDPAQFAEALRRSAEFPNLELRQGDAYAPPLEANEWASFDLVHARFLLEHLERPRDAVAVMFEAVASGGRVALCDDDHSLMRFDPPCPRIEKLWSDYVQLYAKQGNDPFVGRRLTSFLAEVGIPPEQTTQVDFGATFHEPEFGAVVRNLIEILEGVREQIEGVDAALADFRAWATQPSATVWYALPLAVGRRR